MLARLTFLSTLLASTVAFAANDDVRLLDSAGTTVRTTLEAPATGSANVKFIVPPNVGSANNLLNTDGAGNLTWTGTPTISGANFSSVPAGTALTGVTPVANGGTGGATGAAAAAVLGVSYNVCTPTVVNATLTGVVTDTVMIYCKVPGGLMTAGSRIIIDFGWGGAGGGTHTLKLRIGTSHTISDTSCATGSAIDKNTSDLYFIAIDAASTNDCFSDIGTYDQITPTASNIVNVASDFYITLSGAVTTASETITNPFMMVRYVPATGGL